MAARSLTAALDRFVANPAHHDVLAILKGARNGLVYGARVRAPHALVMTLVFHSGSLRQRLMYVYRATKQHSLNLARFVAIYKTALLLQKTLAGGKERKFDTFFAGLVGGWFVFGERNAVNEQIVLYVVSRVISSFLPRATAAPAPSAARAATPSTAPDGFPHPPGFPYPKSRPPHPKVFELYAALAWGAVMYLFREKRDRLHGGMVSSMQYLYLDSEVWNSVKTLLWLPGDFLLAIPPTMPAPRLATKMRGAAPAVRTFASTSQARLPPKLSSKAALWAKNKKNASADDESSSSSAGTGNVLSEVTLPRPDLSGLKAMHPEDLVKASVGQVRAFPEPVLELFKSSSIPNSLKREHAFSTRPATVVRQTTLDLTARLDKASKASSRDARFILTGDKGVGKSSLLLQAASFAQSNKWIVLYIPSAAPLVNSSTPHNYSSTRALFEQPLLASSLLSKFTAANKAAFKAVKTQKEWTFGDKKVAASKSLEELAKAAGGDEKLSTAVFEAVFAELEGQKNFPVLLAIDDAQSLFATSKYIDPTYQALETFSLVIPRMLLELVSGQRSFSRGSVAIAPSSLSPLSSPAMTDFLASPSTAVSRTQALASAYDRSRVPSFPTYSAILEAGLERFAVPERLDRAEAVGIVNLLKGWRGTRQVVDDKAFLEKLVAADGNPREFTRALTQTMAV
ncbi:mitochondrial 37S ribosomal protein mS29 RSM23 [Rhodotorula paludigena]|uniref:mitochondrial 37S ribosomal protein mS29 RSM23 n=1 Tax=Rhodotorula paludigena TaxID=86838 RepID=UPI00317948D7